MEKVGVLIERLLEQYRNKSNPEQLRVTAQLLLSELDKRQENTEETHSIVSVFFPSMSASGTESDILEQVIQSKAQPKEEIPVKIKPEPAAVGEEKKGYNFFDPMVEIPTLALKQQEMNEAIASRQESLNDKLKSVSARKEVAHNIKDGPIKDLRKAIGINDQYLFINELFRGDQTMYERSIKTINSFNIYGEAELWIKRELKLKLAWNDNTEPVQLFDQLVKRRFS